MLKYVQPQIKACKLAIVALERERRSKFATGNAAYLSGVRGSIMEGEITGAPFQWVEDDRQKYIEYSEAIRQLEDMIEILEDACASDVATQHSVHPTPVRLRQNSQPVIVEDQLELPAFSG